MSGTVVSTPLVGPRDEAAARRIRQPGDSWLKTAILTAIAVFVAMVFVLPAAWVVISSFRPDADVFGSISPLDWGIIIPDRVTLEHYIAAFRGRFGLSVWNSAVVCVFSVIFGLAMSAMAAYALAMFRFKGRAIVFSVIVITFMVPFEAIAIPLAREFSDWGLANTLIALILPGLGNGLAIFNLRQFFLGIPSAFREAAMIDGASEPRILFSIYTRMSGAAFVNCGMMIFLGQWGAYLWPTLIISDPNLQVGQVALALSLTGLTGHEYHFGQNFAGAVVLSLVPALLMLVFQPFFARFSFSSGER